MTKILKLITEQWQSEFPICSIDLVEYHWRANHLFPGNSKTATLSPKVLNINLLLTLKMNNIKDQLLITDDQYLFIETRWRKRLFNW